MPEMNIRQPGRIDSACGRLTKYKEKIQKFKDIGDARKTYQNELHKVCFQVDITYGDFKKFSRIIGASKGLCDKTFNIAMNSRYDEYHRGLASMVYKFFDKKSATCANTSGGAIKS